MTSLCKCCESAQAKDLFYCNGELVAMCQKCADLLEKMEVEAETEEDSEW